MIEIIPAILPKNIGDIRGKLSLIRELVTMVQIDLCDGNFVSAQTWPYNGTDTQVYEKIMSEEEGLPFWDEFDFEFDLMVKDAASQFDTFIRLGARRLVFHFEAEDQTDDAFKQFLEGIDLYAREMVSIGVAINTTTDPELLFSLIPHIDFVQCMGIEKIGRQGEPFDQRVLEQLRTLREKYPELPLAVDGAVSIENAHDLVAAGATRLVVGSAIWQSDDIYLTIDNLQNLVIE